MANQTIVVTGATGQLGRLVVADVRRLAPEATVVGVVRDASKAQDLADAGVQLRVANYDNPASVQAALKGADNVLLISGSEVGRRVPQHQAVIDAAKAHGVKLLAYTSLVAADTLPLTLAAEHKATEAAIRASGVPFVVLRNSWYTENYTEHLAPVLQFHAVLGSAGQGRISAATRADYALAAATVLTTEPSAVVGHTYELGGDVSFTMAEFAAEVARQSGVPVTYRDLPPAAYVAALVQAGVPEALASLLAERDEKIAAGEVPEAAGTLSRLIGRPTTTLADAVRDALAHLNVATATP